MRALIATLAAVSTLALAGFLIGAPPAQAAQSECKFRYNLCLARCPGTVQRCLKRCRDRYQGCISRRPYLGDLIGQ
jgi:hypothetical protein